MRRRGLMGASGGGSGGGHIYGVEWAGGASSVCTRTDDSALFADPVPYVAGATEYGSPFDNLMPWSGMVRVTDAAAGELVAIPKFWYKLTQVGANGIKIQIADSPADGFHVSPAHMDREDGHGERNMAYVGRYHCAGNYKSQTGEAPKARIARSEARSRVHALGSDVWQLDFATLFTLWLLYIVEFANWDSQAKIGYGEGIPNTILNAGYTDNMPYHTGTTLSSRTEYGSSTQYRNIEGLWDNVQDWCDGCTYSGSGFNIIKNPSSFSDYGGVTAGSWSFKSFNYCPIGLSVKDISGIFPLFIPNAVAGSGGLTDMWGFPYTPSSSPCVSVGGGYGNRTASRGFFCVLSNSTSTSGDSIGCRLMKLPNN